jgi:transcriptional regulator with GAF, ATPase, and Fis domain
MLDLIERVADSDANMLILGETGTGKELVANAIHQRSRPANAFVKINCAAMPAELIESELFGYKKGAFTGAMLDRKGLFELAENGSLLLDEIGEMPSCLQTKLLRVLQEREYRPLGGQRTARVNFRLLTATNTNVACARQEARLREDLYFRINTVIIQVPPLRERAEDIPLLCEHFLQEFRQRYRKAVGTISRAAASVLREYPWPGNVRELEHAIERAVVLCKGTEIGIGDLPDSLRRPAGGAPPVDFVMPSTHTLADIEKTAILQTLSRTNWNRSEAADILGLRCPTLDSRMKKHGIRSGVSSDGGRRSAAGRSPSRLRS